MLNVHGVGFPWNLLLRTTYKRELIEKEKETENFLEKFYSKHDPDLGKLKSLGTHLGGDRELEDKTKWSNFEAVKDAQVLENTILPSWLYDYLKFRSVLIPEFVSEIEIV